MICKGFDPILTKSITFIFNCPNCGANIQRTITNIPRQNPNAKKDTQRGTENPDSFVIKCPKCSKSYIVQFGASSAGGDIYSADLPDDTDVIVKEESKD